MQGSCANTNVRDGAGGGSAAARVLPGARLQEPQLPQGSRCAAMLHELPGGEPAGARRFESDGTNTSACRNSGSCLHVVIAACLQEHSSSSVGQLPRGLPVFLMHDMADCCHVGDCVEITGVVVLQPQGPLATGAPPSPSYRAAVTLGGQ